MSSGAFGRQTDSRGSDLCLQQKTKKHGEPWQRRAGTKTKQRGDEGKEKIREREKVSALRERESDQATESVRENENRGRTVF